MEKRQKHKTIRKREKSVIKVKHKKQCSSAVKAKREESEDVCNDNASIFRHTTDEFSNINGSNKVSNKENMLIKTMNLRSGQYTDLDSDDIERATCFLRRVSDGTDGLESPLLGSFIVGRSCPRFSPMSTNRRFVQILHTYDHWLCASNVNSANDHDIYVYDSAAGSEIPSEVDRRLSCLLRLTETPDNMVIRERNVSQQPKGSRACGYYAIAYAVAVCSGYDPTLWRFKCSDVVDSVNKFLTSGKLAEPLRHSVVDDTLDSAVYKRSKLHCMCNKTSGNKCNTTGMLIKRLACQCALQVSTVICIKIECNCFSVTYWSNRGLRILRIM